MPLAAKSWVIEPNRRRDRLMNPTTEFFQRDPALQLSAFTPICETSVLRSPRIAPLFDIIPT